MIACVILLVSLCFVNGFLLDTSNQQHSAGPNNVPYLTVSEFVDDKKQQQRELDRTLALLTSQLQQRFAAMETKINDLERTNETLQTENKWENKFHELEKKYTNLKTNFNTLHAENLLMKIEVSKMQNETVEFKAELGALKKLGNIHPLQDLLTIQQKVQAVEAKTNILSVNQQARNQDFLALYNETLISKQKLSDLETQTNYRIKKLQTNQTQTVEILQHEFDGKMSFLRNQTNGSLDKLKTYQNQTIIKMKNEFEHEIEGLRKIQNMTTDTLTTKINDFKKEENKTVIALQDKIASNSERVAYTGCTSSTTRSSGYIIRFSDVKYQVGMQHLNDLKNSGKFTCEKQGLYQISTTITSSTSGAQYHIYKNGASVAFRYMTFNGGVHSTSAIIVLELNVSDTVWVQTGYIMYVYGGWSCLSVIKVK